MLRRLILPLLIIIISAGLMIAQENRSLQVNLTSFSDQSDSQAPTQVLIVPHHNLVSAQRSQLFADAIAAGARSKKIVLLSPNHYESGTGLIQTTDQIWETSLGTIQPNSALIAELLAAGVKNEPTSFNNEHGIRTILPDIVTYFPDATIVPLILSNRLTQQQSTDLANLLNQQCSDCLVIVSVDFSHYQPAILADLHDKLSLRALQNLDLDALYAEVEVDSPSSLVVAAQIAKQRQAQRFTLKNQTNSGNLIQDYDEPTTTHIFAWYAAGDPVSPAPSLTFLLGGDVMLDRSVADQYFFKTGDFTTILSRWSDRTFWGTDLAMLNLEGPISPTPVDNNTQANNLVFNFPPESIKVVTGLNLNAVSLANNHSLNAGKSGLANTEKVLSDAKVTPIGGPSDSDTVKTATFTGQTINLHVITVHTLSSNPNLTTLIQSLKKTDNDRVLIFPHWGTEYATKHSSSQASQAHAWVEAGADLVVGAHPHVVQDAEVYQGVPIIYSLGNFIFDQWFSVETQRGMMIGGEFSADGLRLFGLPIGIINSQPYLLSGAEKLERIDRIYSPLSEYVRSTPAGSELYFPLVQE